MVGSGVGENILILKHHYLKCEVSFLRSETYAFDAKIGIADYVFRFLLLAETKTFATAITKLSGSTGLAT